MSWITRTRGLAILAVLVVVGCEPPGKPDPSRRLQPPDRLPEYVYLEDEKVSAFEYLYDQNCRACHGKDGKGGPAPPLNNALFLALVDESFLENTIAQGREGTLMPAFGRSFGGTMPDLAGKGPDAPTNQTRLLAQGIMKKWGGLKPREAKDAPDYFAGQRRGDMKQGLEVFARACATCHGEMGEGGEMAGAISNPAFLTLMSEQALRRIIITGRPDLKDRMPNYASSEGRGKDFKPLTDVDVADLMALLSFWRNKGPLASR
jgi:mono/diheme cytochrome c family protein